MQLGAFSISLAVKDIKASKAFYEKLGFTSFGGEHRAELDRPEERPARDRTVPGHVREEHADLQSRLGPGGEERADPFTDVRELQKQLKAQGVAFVTEADETHDGTRQLHADGSRRQSDPGRSTPLSATVDGADPVAHRYAAPLA